jgi:hypothetical protein
MLSDELLVQSLKNHHFGLIYYGQTVSDYFKNVIAGKLTTYLYCNLPVICFSNYLSMCELIKRNKYGIIFNNLSELNYKNLNSFDYDSCYQKIQHLDLLIRNGEHYKKALKKLKYEKT